MHYHMIQTGDCSVASAYTHPKSHTWPCHVVCFVLLCSHALENHHVSAAFRLMRRMNACPWEDWPAATKQAARQRIIDVRERLRGGQYPMEP